MTAKGKRGRGSVTRAFNQQRRWQKPEYKEKRKEERREYYQKNREKELKRIRGYEKELNEFANKRCKKCNKLLNHRTKGEYCRKHYSRQKRKTKK